MFLDRYMQEIKGLCQEHNVKTLYAFGSVLTDNFGPESDVDFLVDIKSSDPIDYAENYFDLKFKLQDLFKKPIDLLEQKGLKNSRLIKNIDNSKIMLYKA